MPGAIAPPASAAHGSLRRLRVAGLALVFAALAIVTTAGPAFAWSVSSFSPGDEQLLFSLTNQDRASAGLNALVNDSYLHTKAEWRSKDMGDRNYFSHQIPPDNLTVFNYMQRDGYCYKVAGENIGLSTYGDDVATNRMETAFMGSVSHRANILGTWAHMGVGAYKAADGRKLYTVLFSIPCGVTVPTPTPVTTPPPTEGPAPTPTLPPAPTPTLPPAPKPTPRPTAKPVVTVAPTLTPTETPVPTVTVTPTPTPLPVPTASSAAAVPSPSHANPTAGLPPADTVTSLRVREKPAPEGPLDALFRWLFGGLFGW
jgi:uncharacterized protein YkwD